MKKIFVAVSFAVCLFWNAGAQALTENGFEALDIFTRILSIVESDYVEPVEDDKMLRGAIRGLLSGLDPHTVYLSPEIYKHLKADTAGLFGGVGLEITIRDGWVTVVTPLEGTPAFKAGIQPGDRILMIDGKSTKGMDLGIAVQEMRGRRGSAIRLTLGRSGMRQPMRVTLKRQVIRAPSIRAELHSEKFLYVKISSFQERTAGDLRETLHKHKDAVQGYGMILDLRNNPGGLLDQAVRVCDLFLDSGVIVSTASRKGEIDRQEATEGEEEFGRFPLIILVNGGSASASEIVAGALQDHRRAVVMGTQSFGKGSVQSVIELDDGSALKITIARYFTPSGRSIQAEGVRPDVLVEPTPPKEEGAVQEASAPLPREEDLEGHLEKIIEAPTPVKEAIAGLPYDHQKAVALNYLESWNIFQKKRK